MSSFKPDAPSSDLLLPTDVRPEALTCPPYVAGLSIEEIQEKYNLSSVIKLASNENPLGASSLVQRALRDKAASAFRYPQSGSPKLHQAIADHLKVDVARVVCGNGSDELIDLLIRVRAVPGKHNIVAFKPCFALYEIQARFAGVEFRQASLKEDFTFDVNAFLDLVDKNTRLAFITTPDNPSGHCPPAAEVVDLIRALPPACLLVIDEAYIDFCGDFARYSLLSRLEEFPNVVIMRTFSKVYGLAGMRIGYAVAPVPLADVLRRVRLPFSVNLLAEAAGIAALQDTTFYEATLAAVSEGRERIAAAFADMGFKVYPSKANFLLMRPPYAAQRFVEDLLERGVIIRWLRSYGMPDFIRISIGNAEENERLISTAAELVRANRAARA